MQEITDTLDSVNLKYTPEDFKHAIVLYPAYFDIRKSIGQGRRVPKSLAVNTDLQKNGIPLTAWHLAAACEQLGLVSAVEEGKRYTRDYWGYGRIRVLFDKARGASHPVHGKVKSKEELIRVVAKLLPAIQMAQLEQLRKDVENSKAQTGLTAEFLAFPLKPEHWPYSRDPRANSAMKFGYGAVPLVDLRPKTSASSSGASGSSSSKKKKK